MPPSESAGTGAAYFAPRVQYVQWLLQQSIANPAFTASILFSDEACFTRDGYFNSRNSHIWAAENPHAKFIHGHQDLRLQHDGAPAYFSRDLREHLNNTYRGCWIGRGGPVAWPLRSPDLTPMDLFIWEHVKSVVYSVPVATRQELVERIFAACDQQRQRPDIFATVRQSLQRCCTECSMIQGGHFEHLLERLPHEKQIATNIYAGIEQGVTSTSQEKSKAARTQVTVSAAIASTTCLLMTRTAMIMLNASYVENCIRVISGERRAQEPRSHHVVTSPIAILDVTDLSPLTRVTFDIDLDLD
ncbi:hypothetical protein PR048_004773 [Dryococelus australis]|uniref:Uncharacterized protein n=1 Tax=Dryococelus australis TaxID=614101 RepID=A0ABQ9I8C4_9NEOP|nr:hypothetical protein PR048_004773 [Dryococelus australis]